MTFATIIALLAFFIAMLALWLSSDIVKKVENQNDKFIKAHVATIREDLRDMDRIVQKTQAQSARQTETQSDQDKRLSDHTKALGVLSDRVAQLSVQLEELDRSIPSRYRVRVRKAEDTPPKPSIQ